jgi:hypothetical protein
VHTCHVRPDHALLCCLHSSLARCGAQQQLDSLATDYSAPGSNFYRRATAAFRRMVLHAGAQVGANIVLVDMGPSTDVINRTFATSCDVIQPCTAPEMFSWSGSVMQTVVVLPDWLKFFVERRQLDQSGAAASGPAWAEDNYNPLFPRIMPFVGMQVGTLGSAADDPRVLGTWLCSIGCAGCKLLCSKLCCTWSTWLNDMYSRTCPGCAAFCSYKWRCNCKHLTGVAH